MAHSIQEALDIAGTENESFIMGGGMVYKQMLPIARKLYLTIVHKSFEADTYFPDIDYSEWKETETEFVDAGEKNQYPHTYKLLIRKQ